MDPTLIIFAIESALRLGRKLNEILIDDTHEKPLLLPLGDLHANVTENHAVEFFDRMENTHLVDQGGPYFGFDDAQLAKAYTTLTALDERLGGGKTLLEATDMVVELHRFEQLKEDFGANSPVQRVLGTLVEVGIDYFAAYPAALAQGGNGRKVLSAFIAQLDEVELAEGNREHLVGDVLLSALRVLDDSVGLVDDDKRLQALLGGVTEAVIGEIDDTTTEGEKIRREDLFKRIGKSVLRGSMTALTENTGLFLPDDGAARPIVESTLRQTLASLRGHEDLFSSESVELIFNNALRAVGENPRLFTDEGILRELIASTTAVLTAPEVEDVLPRETASAILAAGIRVTATNVATLIDTEQPRAQLLASTVSALAHGLSDDLAGGKQFRNLLSRSQLVELSSIVFQQAVRNPKRLLGEDPGETRRSALAQVVASVAAALGKNPRNLASGQDALELIQMALHAGVRNTDKLLDLHNEAPTSNLLFRVIRDLALGAMEADDPRGLLSRDVFLKIVEHALPVASSHVGPLLTGESPVVKETVMTAFKLTTGVIENRTNGENLPVLIERLLADVLSGALNLERHDEVLTHATEILQAA